MLDLLTEQSKGENRAQDVVSMTIGYRELDWRLAAAVATCISQSFHYRIRFVGF